MIVRQCVLLLPLRSVQLVGASVGVLAYYLVAGRRKITLDNLQHAFPEKSDSERIRIAKGAFRNYGIALFEFLWFPRLTESILRELVSCDQADWMKQCYAQKKGLIMLSGHFGNWELIALATSYYLGQPYAIIVQTQSNELIDEVINRHRCMMGSRVVPMGISVREILSTLRRGGVVAIAPDQSGAVEGAYVEFFGRKVATHQGPAVFALKTGAMIIMGYLERKPDGRYICRTEEVSTENLPDDPEEAVVELTRRHTSMLERYIRKHPDHWLWMHRRWKHLLSDLQSEPQKKSEAAA